MTGLMTPLVGEMTLGLWLGLAAAIVFLAVLPTLAVFALYYAAFEDEDKHVADVQRFIALRAEARSLMSPGLPLLDDDRMAAATNEIGRFQAKRDEAHRALSPLGDPSQAETAQTPAGVDPRGPRAARDHQIGLVRTVNVALPGRGARFGRGSRPRAS